MAKQNKHWTIREAENLRAMYKILPRTAIAQRLGLTEGVVKSALERYKITKVRRDRVPELSEFIAHIEAIRAELDLSTNS